MRKLLSAAIGFLLLILCPFLPLYSAEPARTTSDTTRFCVILQIKQARGGKAYHLIIGGDRGFYRLYQQPGGDGYALARNERKNGGQQQVLEMGGFRVKADLDERHTLICEMINGKIRVFFDGGLVWTAEDPAPLPIAGAELKVFVPGAKPGDPQKGEAPDPEYSLVFYRIEAPAVVASGATLSDDTPAPGRPVLLMSEDFEQMRGGVPDKWRSITDDFTGSRVLTTAAAGNDASRMIITQLPALADFLWEARVRLVNTNANLYFRLTERNDYGLRIEPSRLVLWTERNGALADLAAADVAIGKAWHDYRIAAVGRRIVVEVDRMDSKPVIFDSRGAELRAAIIFTDGDAASLSGGIAFEAFGNDGARFDDFKFYKISAN